MGRGGLRCSDSAEEAITRSNVEVGWKQSRAAADFVTLMEMCLAAVIDRGEGRQRRCEGAGRSASLATVSAGVRLFVPKGLQSEY